MQHRYLPQIPKSGVCFWLLLIGWLASRTTLAQPVLVKDIYPGASSSEISSVVSLNGTLFFSASNGTQGGELWKSDGTPEGTFLVKDINPLGSSAPSNFTVVGDKLYFTANDGTTGNELWQSDGTDEGTRLVRDINPGPGGSNPNYLIAANNLLFFLADDGVNGRELWKSNGAPAGTSLVKDLAPGTSNADITELTSVNGVLYFLKGPQQYGLYEGLWKSDGTEQGTVVVKQNIQGSFFTALNGRLYFLMGRGTSSLSLWESDGTEDGTKWVSTIKESSFGPDYGEGPLSMRNVEGMLYIAFSEGSFIPTLLDTELYKSDGTADGTSYVRRLFQSHYRSPSQLGAYTFSKTDLYYSVSGGIPAPNTPTVERGLTKQPLDGGEAILIKDVHPERLKVVGNTVYFTVNGKELWKSDGTAAGTTLVADLNAAGSANPVPLVGINGVLYLLADNGVTGAELYKYDPNYIPVTPGTLRLNAGGPTYTSSDNKVFSADNYYTGGNIGQATGEVANTDNDSLYLTERWGAPFSYKLPVKNGSYTVTLHFNELYFGNLAPGGAGSRKFNVDVEGSRKLTEFDIFAEAGGAMKAIQKTYTISVSDSVLNLDFTAGSANFPKISAIEVVPALLPTTYLLNTLGTPYTSSDGREFTPDNGLVTGGQTAAVPDNTPISGTLDEKLYRSERWGIFSYKLPIVNGTYRVSLYLTEFYFGNLAPGGAGSRKFNVDMEGSRKLTEFDIYARSGGALRAGQANFTVTVSDGVLNIDFLEGSANFPKISAIEVVPVTAAARAASREIAAREVFRATLSPNPVEDRFVVELPVAANQVRNTAIQTLNGQVLQRNSHRIAGEKQLQFEAGTLKGGLYLLQLDTPLGRQVIKFVRQ